MHPLLGQSLRRIGRYCRRNLLLAHLVEIGEGDKRWPDWAASRDTPRTPAEANPPRALINDAAKLLAMTASIYLLVAILVGILSQSC